MINKIAKVYVYKIKHNYSNRIDWFNKNRLLQINKCLNNTTRQQKIYSWLLINYALQKELKEDSVEQKYFELVNDSFWKYKNYYFTISHSGKYVAIAISLHKIGIDLELFDREKFKRSIWNRIVGSNKNMDYSPLSCLILWIKKEAFFKQTSQNYVLKPNKEQSKKITIINIKKTRIWLAITCDKKNLRLSIDI